MPKYGLTRAQIATRPWGLDPALLEPSKTITDAIYPSVYLNRLERMILDSSAMQRLRRIRQLGNSHLVYPSATHSRFSHSLGTLRRTQDMLDAVIGHGSGLHPTPDLFTETQRRLGPDEFNLYVAEVTILARLGALLHDIGHIAFGHTVEDNLQLLPSHDSNKHRLDALWATLPREVWAESGRLEHHLKGLVLSKAADSLGRDVRYDYPFVDDLVNNNVCADLLDYLERDHEGTGLPFAVGERFLDYFYVTPSSARHPKRVVLQAQRNGKRRQDLLDEVVKILRYRYEETQRVLFHHTKLAADAMLGHLVVLMFEIIWREALYGVVGGDRAALGRVRSLNAGGHSRAAIEEDLISRSADPKAPGQEMPPLDNVVLGQLPKYGGTEDRLSAEPRYTRMWFDALNDHALASLELLFRRHGDDGLLETIALYWGGESLTDAHVLLTDLQLPVGAVRPAGTGALRDVAARLAGELLNRELYVEVGECGFEPQPSGDPSTVAVSFARKYGHADVRLDLEARLAAFLGYSGEPACLMWVPDVNMQLKPAGLLVNVGEGAVTLEDVGIDDAVRLAKRHQQMWGLRVFARRSELASANLIRAWLTTEFLQESFSVVWKGLAPPSLWDCVRRELEVADVEIRAHDLAEVEKEFDNLVMAARAKGGASSASTFQDLVLAVRALCENHG